MSCFDYRKLVLAQVNFQSFGDFFSTASVGPKRKNYADQFVDVLGYRLESALGKGALSWRESEEIRSAVLCCLKQYRDQLDVEVAPAVIVLDDMHPAIFFVDESGRAAGFFDIEFTCSYHGVVDGFRDDWSARFKRLVLEWV